MTAKFLLRIWHMRKNKGLAIAVSGYVSATSVSLLLSLRYACAASIVRGSQHHGWRSSTDRGAGPPGPVWGSPPSATPVLVLIPHDLAQ
jgi:hypothetical protein